MEYPREEEHDEIIRKILDIAHRRDIIHIQTCVGNFPGHHNVLSWSVCLEELATVGKLRRVEDVAWFSAYRLGWFNPQV